MDVTTELSQSYKDEVQAELSNATCKNCYDRGFYLIFNAYEPESQQVMHCDCMLGVMFLDSQLKALNSEPD